MNVKIPTLEDKIYDFFMNLLLLRNEELNDLNREELKQVIDESIEENGLTMDTIINYLLNGMEKGYSIDEQFELFKEYITKND